MLLSRYQVAVLRKVRIDGINVERIGKYKDTTIYWLFKRGYLYRLKDMIYLTKEGDDAISSYLNCELPIRKEKADITDRTARYLRVVRMRKAS